MAKSLQKRSQIFQLTVSTICDESEMINWVEKILKQYIVMATENIIPWLVLDSY